MDEFSILLLSYSQRQNVITIWIYQRQPNVATKHQVYRGSTEITLCFDPWRLQALLIFVLEHLICCYPKQSSTIPLQEEERDLRCLVRY